MQFLCVQDTIPIQPYLCLTFKVIRRISLTGLKKDEIISFALSCAVMIYFPGHETFFGRLLHSWEYKDADSFKGKRVVVVGIGNSGGDVAVEISRSAEKVSK